MEEDKKTYIISLRCINCYHNFDYEFPQGHEVKELGFGDYHFIHKPNNIYENILCPKCGCSNIVKIKPY